MASQGAAAKHLGLSRRQFVDLLDAGHITRKPENGYELETVVHEAIEYFRNRGLSEVEEQRARAFRIQADKGEMDIAERKRLTGPLSMLRDAWLKIAAVFRTKTQAIPSSKAHLFVGLKTVAQAQARLTEVVDELLRSIAATDPADALGLPGRSVRKRSAEVEADHVGMG